MNMSQLGTVGMGGFSPPRVLAAIIVAASLAVIAAAQNSFSPSEQTQIIEKARKVALQYTTNLPNFISTETIRRSTFPKRSQTWKFEDILTVDVAFSENGERYNMLTINGKPTKKTFHQVGGVTSDGEFGTILRWIFRPESATKFNFERFEELRGRPIYVFSYGIEQAKSEYKAWGINVAFAGLIYVDRESCQVMRITHVLSGMPVRLPATAVSADLDYGFAEIGGQKFLLPLHAELNLTLRDGSQTRNVMDFANYRKFSSEATLKFEP